MATLKFTLVMFGNLLLIDTLLFFCSSATLYVFPERWQISVNMKETIFPLNVKESRRWEDADFNVTPQNR